MTERMEISSRATPFFKFVLPFVVLAFLAFVSLVLFIDKNPVAWIALAAFAVVLAILALTCFPLKRVHVEANDLVVSNFIRIERVPLSEVERITEMPLLSTHPIWLHLRNKSHFGKKLMFMPKTAWDPRTLLKSHRVVQDLVNTIGTQGHLNSK